MKAKSSAKLVKAIADSTGLTKQRVQIVMDALSTTIARELSVNGPGVFIMPGCFKVTRKISKAKPERQGVNPFTGEKCTFKAKPASNRFAIRPLKNLKELKVK